MKLKKIFLVLATVLVLTSGFLVYKKTAAVTKIEADTQGVENVDRLSDAEQQYTSNEDVYSPETSYPITTVSACIAKGYSSLNELYSDADIVAKVKIKSQETIDENHDAFINTISQAEIKNIFKGDKNLEIVTIWETGGTLDQSTLVEKNKPGDGSAAKTGIVEMAFEGVPVMKTNNSYYVFLKQCKDPKYGYFVAGSYQGKLKFDENSKTIVTTVKKDKASNNLLYLQRNYGGKSVKEFDNALNKLK